MEPIDHQAYQPLPLLPIEPINHQAYQLLSLLPIEPINLWSSFATFKPFGLFPSQMLNGGGGLFDHS